jgi:hypothetical protein
MDAGILGKCLFSLFKVLHGGERILAAMSSSGNTGSINEPNVMTPLRFQHNEDICPPPETGALKIKGLHVSGPGIKLIQ